MKVSFVVPVFNEEENISLLLNSLINQIYPIEKTEIIIVDDCSFDATANTLRTENLPAHFKTIFHKTNLGRSESRNSALKKITGDIIFFIDADIIIPKNFIQQHIAIHKNSEIAGVIGNLVPPENIHLDKFRKYLFYGTRGTKTRNHQNGLMPNQFLLGNTSIKREIVKKVGLFDISLSGYGGEDFDYSMRLFESTKKKFVYAEHIESVQYSTRTLAKTLPLFVEYGQGNLPKIIKKHPKAEALILHNFHKGWRKLFAGFLFNCLFRPILRLLYYISPYPVSNLFVKILLLDSLLKGYKNK